MKEKSEGVYNMKSNEITKIIVITRQPDALLHSLNNVITQES